MTKNYLSFVKSEILFKNAKKFIAGGVSSTARGKPRGILPGIHPAFIEKAFGSHFIDVDGNEFIDYLQAYGAIILGFSHPTINEAIEQQLQKGQMFGLSSEIEQKVAKMIVNNIPCADLVMFSNTGSEATSMALKTARAYTGKEKIIKFEGAYHGWLDWCMVDSTLTAATTTEWVRERYVPLYTFKTIVEPGVPRSVMNDIIVLPWNDIETFERIIDRHGNEVAAVILEPTGPLGCILPENGFLQKIKNYCKKNGILTIFDEIKTGFRLGLGGAQGYYKVTPDLATLGKALGNGLPVSAIVGKKDIMNLVAEYRVSHDGTYNGNPLCMAAVLANLKELHKTGIYDQIFEKGRNLIGGIRDFIEDIGVQAQILGEPPMAKLVFSKTKLTNIREYPRDIRIKEKDEIFRLEMLKRGVHTLDLWFISVAHSSKDVENTIQAAGDTLKELKKGTK